MKLSVTSICDFQMILDPEAAILICMVQEQRLQKGIIRFS